MKHSLYIGKILGVGIYIHWTFIFLVAWIVFTGFRAGRGPGEILWTLGLITAVFACIVLHELAHATMAKRFKVVTTHITLLPIGGVAQLESMPENPKQEFLIAIVGPLVNVVVALTLTPLVNLHELLQTKSVAVLGPSNFLFSLIVINIWLAIFNLIPAFPMDGGRVLRAILAFRWGHVKATRVAALIGQLFGAAFIIAGFLYSPILIFIGAFIFLTAQYESSVVDTVQFLHAYITKDVMMHDIPVIENNLSLKSAGQILLNTQNRNFVVMDRGRPVGTVTRDSIIRAVSEKGEEITVQDIKDDNLSYVTEKTPLDEAWKIMRQKRTPLILIRNNGEIDGIVEAENIAEFILLRSGSGVQNKKVKSAW